MRYELRKLNRVLATFDTYAAAMVAYDEAVEGLDYIATSRLQVWGSNGLGYCTGMRYRTDEEFVPAVVDVADGERGGTR